MVMDRILDYLNKLADTEWFHHNVYRKFSEVERDPTVKKMLLEFSDIEYGASRFWDKMVVQHGGGLPKHRSYWLSTKWILFLRSLFSAGFALEALEYSEEQMGNSLKKLLAISKNRSERKQIMEFLRKAEGIEAKLEGEIHRHSKILNNIRDIVFGINDGLVEVLAATVGFAAALQTQPFLVFFAGSIVAISGTLSMAGGAYIATKYESVISKEGADSGIKSAFYVGISYICGAIFPLLPFVFGMKGLEGAAVSIIITALVLSFTAALIAIVSRRSVSKRILENLAVSLGAAAVTIVLGLYARYVLKIVI
jgi:VIT1/CCC1 family predicted Fe2+/Mn2+ transporter